MVNATTHAERWRRARLEWRGRDACGCGADAPIGVKGGSLDEPLDLSGAIHIWTSRKLPGIVIPTGATRYPDEPE